MAVLKLKLTSQGSGESRVRRTLKIYVSASDDILKGCAKISIHKRRETRMQSFC